VSKTKVILLELNELTPSLMEKFIQEGHLPNFANMKAKSQVYITDANASGEELNPWIQWVTVHTGLTPKEHGVFLLNDLDKFKGDFIWDKLSQEGISSWVCGSMNTKYQNGFKGDFIPDPWATNSSPFPVNKYDTYFSFISQSVKGYSSNDHISSSQFVKYLIKNGLRVSTLFKIAKQVISEIFIKDISWKRALVLDWIQFDIFKKTYKNNNHQFATLFSNSTAHYQHHYWRDMDPIAFGEDQKVVNKHKQGAILSAYKNMDKLVGEVMEMADNDTVIGFITALSQKPYTDTQRFYYHINSIEAFKSLFQIQQEFIYKPIMAEQFHLECNNEEDAIALADNLEKFNMDSNEYFHVGSKQVLLINREGNCVHVQCRCTKSTPKTAKIIHKEGALSFDFSEAFYQMDEIKSGKHDPHGMFWLYNTKIPAEYHKEVLPLEQTYNKLLSMIK